MKHATTLQSSFATLFDPAIARAVAERAAQWDLPRHTCRPLDRYFGARVGSDLAAYDDAVDAAPLSAEEMHEEVLGAASEDSGFDHNVDFEDDADFEDDDDL
jgi:hypothetical protein